MILLTIDIIAQIFAVVLGCWSMWLVNQKHKDHPNKKWACILGLISEPFWNRNPQVSTCFHCCPRSRFLQILC